MSAAVKRIVYTPAERASQKARIARLARMMDRAQNKIIQGPVEASIMMGLIAAYGEGCTIPAIAAALEISPDTIRYRMDKIRLRLIREEHKMKISNAGGVWFIEPVYPDALETMFDLCVRIIARDQADVALDDLSGAMLIPRRMPTSATPSSMIGCGA